MIISNSLYDNTIIPKKWKNTFVHFHYNINIACKHSNGLILVQQNDTY